MLSYSYYHIIIFISYLYFILWIPSYCLDAYFAALNLFFKKQTIDCRIIITCVAISIFMSWCTYRIRICFMRSLYLYAAWHAFLLECTSRVLGFPIFSLPQDRQYNPESSLGQMTILCMRNCEARLKLLCQANKQKIESERGEKPEKQNFAILLSGSCSVWLLVNANQSILCFGALKQTKTSDGYIQNYRKDCQIALTLNKAQLGHRSRASQRTSTESAKSTSSQSDWFS